MNNQLILRSFLVGVFAMGCGHAWSSEIDISITPTKSEYLLGEPVSCKFLLKNTSQTTLSILLDYPVYMGLAFMEGKTPAKNEVPPPQGRINITKIDPGQEFAATIVINRYMSIGQGRHEISFTALFGQAGKVASLTASGTFEVSVSNKAISSTHAKLYCDGINDKVQMELREAIELLLWVEEKSVVPCLIKASQILPVASPDVVRALAKFLDTDEGKKALWTIASMDANTLGVAYSICGEKHILPPTEFLNSNIDSPDNGKRWHTVSFLLANGDKSRVPLIEKLLNDPEESIRKLAKKAVEHLNR